MITCDARLHGSFEDTHLLMRLTTVADFPYQPRSPWACRRAALSPCILTHCK